MNFNRALFMLPFVFVLLAVAGNGCRKTFPRRYTDTIDACLYTQTAPNLTVFGFWCNEQRIHLLRTKRKTIKTNGIIAYAVYSTLNKEGHKSLELAYLSKNANVKEIHIINDGKIIWSSPPPSLNYTKRLEKHFVVFNELFVWRTSNPIENYNVRDLSVVLIRDDGSLVGPATIVTDNDVWEEIRGKILVEKEWQTKFSWLYSRLLNDPDMKPLWRNPEKQESREWGG